MTEQPALRAHDEAPTPDETRWASAILNAQKYGRSASDQDKQQAGQIMARARRATQAKKARKVSPLEEARALKAMEVAVAEAQGINDAREGEVPPAPEFPALPEPVPAPSAERLFREAGARLIEDVDRALEALRSEQERLTDRLTSTRSQIAGLDQRRQAILDAIDVVNGAGR